MASPMARRHLLAFIVYRTLYLLLYLILLGLLIVTPVDIIVRSVQHNQRRNIYILAAAYAITIVVVTFVFITRLYINKTDLSSIPKGWVPIEKGDVRSTVYKVIYAGLGRSAAIAYEARPRLEFAKRPRSLDQASWDGSVEAAGYDRVGSLPPHMAAWDNIEHPGWSSPNSLDLPNLQFSTVISELPNLIEAKALTLAPPDPTSDADPPLLDPEAVSLLQRTASMSLRDYVVHLVDLEVLEMDATTVKFLTLYEYARFSTRPLSTAQFKELMHLFADILRTMEPLDPDVLDGELEEDTSAPESSAGGEVLREDDSSASGSDRGGDDGSDSGSIAHRSESASIGSSTRRRAARRKASTNTWNEYRTAPNSMKSGVTRKQSKLSMGSSRRRYPASQKSTLSLRSKASSSSASVIRLATRQDSTDLPYILSLRDTAGS